MALIPCPECGNKISSRASFCPKCARPEENTATNKRKAPSPVSLTFDLPENEISPETSYTADTTASNEELLQVDFKPSSDEMIILEGRTFLVKGVFNVSDCYAYLTSKRYVLCEAAGIHIVFQTGNCSISSVEEGRHFFSKKIVIKTFSGESYHVKSRPHPIWLGALLNPLSAIQALRKPGTNPPTTSGGNLPWHYEEHGEKIGPVRENEMIRFIRNNHTIYRNTPVWNECLPEWKPAEDTILAFYFSEPAVTEADTVQLLGGYGRPRRNMFSWFTSLFARYL